MDSYRLITKYQLNTQPAALVEPVEGAKAGSLVKGLKTNRHVNPLEPQYQFIGQSTDASGANLAVTHLAELSTKQRRDLLLELRKSNDLKISQAMRNQKLQSLPANSSLPQIKQPIVQMHPTFKATACLQSEQLKTIQIAPKASGDSKPSDPPISNPNPGQPVQEPIAIVDNTIQVPLVASSPKIKSHHSDTKPGPSIVLPVVHK